MCNGSKNKGETEEPGNSVGFPFACFPLTQVCTMPKPLFHSVSRPYRSGHHGYSIYEVFLGVFVGFLLTATGMHFVYKMPSQDPGALSASPIGIEEPHYEHGKPP